MLSSTKNRIRHREGNWVANEHPSIITISIAKGKIRHKDIGYRGFGIIGVLQSFISPKGSKIGDKKTEIKKSFSVLLSLLFLTGR